MADEKLRYDKENILAIPDLSIERHYESGGIIPKVSPETEETEKPDRYVETLDDLDSVYKLADLLPSDLATIIRDITDVLRKDTQGKIILQIERTKSTPSEPTPETKTKSIPPEGGTVVLTPPEKLKTKEIEIDDIFSRKPAVTIEVDRGRSLVDIAREAYKQDDSDIKEHYTSMMTQLTNRFFQIMTTLAEESNMDDYTYLMQDFDGTAVTTNDPNQQHLIDSICKGQIIYDQKLRQMNLTHTAANTLCMTRGFHVAEMQRERYLQEQYKKDLKDMPSTFSNDLLEASRSEATKKYKQAAYNEFKYLDNAVKNTNALLNIRIDEASAKAQLSNTGSDIFAFTPLPAPTENQVDDNYDATQSAQQNAQSAIDNAAKDSVTGQQAGAGAGASSGSNNGTAPVNSGSVGGGNVDPGAIYKMLRSYGYSPIAACAIMGNIQQESSFDTGATNSSGYKGLCQWDPNSRWPNMQNVFSGRDPYDAATQMDYMYYEATNTRYPEECGPSGMNAASTDISSAVTHWQYWFEGAKGQETSQRIDYANAFYAMYNT